MGRRARHFLATPAGEGVLVLSGRQELRKPEDVSV
jgi:hypothetical protein